jgi:hypothetical protein
MVNELWVKFKGIFVKAIKWKSDFKVGKGAKKKW